MQRCVQLFERGYGVQQLISQIPAVLRSTAELSILEETDARTELFNATTLTVSLDMMFSRESFCCVVSVGLCLCVCVCG